MEKDRRNKIMKRIEDDCEIIDTGFLLNGSPSPCHIWQKGNSGNGRGGGYGRMKLNGQTVAVHIVVATHYFGYIPRRMQVDHLCNQRACANPAHLEIVTHLINQKRRSVRRTQS